MAKIHCHSLLSGSSWSAFGQETPQEEGEGMSNKFSSDFLWYSRAKVGVDAVLQRLISVLPFHISYGGGGKQCRWV